MVDSPQHVMAHPLKKGLAMRRHAFAALLSVAVPCAALPATAAIVQANANAFTAFGSSPTPIGQSFTAEFTVGLLDTVEFRYLPNVNTTLSAPSVTIDLFDGVGYGGTLLGSTTRSLSGTGAERWEAFQFAMIPLVVGGSYTFRLTGTGSGSYGLQTGDPYPGGDRLDSNGAPVMGLPGDLAFQIFGEIAPPNVIPLPAAGWLLVTGLGALAAIRPRPKKRDHATTTLVDSVSPE